MKVVFLFLIMFLLISCETEELKDSCDNSCSENSHCIVENSEVSCVCNDDYIKSGENCIIDTSKIREYSLFVTGETKTIEDNDDGNTQRGIQRLYEKSGETILDLRTNLLWQDNEKVSKDWNDAKSYCENLDLESKTWRLPSKRELLTLVDFKYNTKINPIFINREANKYWTSTNYFNDSFAYFVNFSDFEDSSREIFNKSNNYSVRCVTQDSILKGSKFIRDDDTNIVKDIVTNLMWEDTISTKDSLKSWSSSISYCEDLELGGFTDWHLPNINELSSIVVDGNFNPALNSSFNNFLDFGDDEKDSNLGNYWSSTINYKNLENSIALNMQNGMSNSYSTTLEMNVRCVRYDKKVSYFEYEYGNIVLNSRYTTPKDIIFIDIRTTSEKSSGYPLGANIDVVYSSSQSDKFIEDIKKVVSDKTKHVILTCASSGRTRSAIKLLANDGFTHVEHIIGGTNKWKSFNLPWSE